MQKSASIQPRTSPSKFGGKFNSLFTSLLSRATAAARPDQSCGPYRCAARGGARRNAERARDEYRIEFSPKLRGARSQLYRRRFLQVNTRWKALAEIYTMHSYAPFSNLNFFVKNRQNFFAIELMNIH